MPKGTFLENDMITSTAFKAIDSPNSMRVLIEFYRRRVFHKRKGHHKPMLMNNGEIELKFDYAIEQMGIAQTTFGRCLDELVELGFLDVAELSCGLHKMPTKWSLSERWRKYGAEDFIKIKRKKLKPPHGKKGTKGKPFGRGVKKNTVTMKGIENDLTATMRGQ